MLERIPFVNNYDPLVPGIYARWMEEIKDVNIFTRDDLLDIMGVSILEWQAMNEKQGVRFVPRTGGGRVRWVPCQRTAVDEEDALNLILTGRVNLHTEVVLEGESTFINQACYVPNITPKIERDSGNEIIITVEAPTKGWLVLADTWYPGWRAQIDGEQVRIYKANYAFRALEIPPGNHEVVFTYQPVSFYTGVTISLLILSGLGWFLIRRRKRKC